MLSLKLVLTGLNWSINWSKLVLKPVYKLVQILVQLVHKLKTSTSYEGIILNESAGDWGIII